MMRLRCGLHCVGRNPDVAIRPILEAHRARQPGRQFPMYLALGGTCSNRAPCHEVGEVLRGDDVEELAPGRQSRSEEHTSELQSLMRISYAVFCLKKKTNANRNRRLSMLGHDHEQQLPTT